MNALAAIILALLKAIPALDNLVSAGLAERARQREAQALARKHAKDAAADAAIDAPPKS